MRTIEDKSTVAIPIFFSGDEPMDVTDTKVDMLQPLPSAQGLGDDWHRPSRGIVKRGKRPAAGAASATKEIERLHSSVDFAATELMCPIRHELPIEPVVAADGHIYEKAAIEEWLARELKSPMTNLAMGTQLTPLVGVRNAISELVRSGALDSAKATEWLRKIADKDKVERLHRAADGGDVEAMFRLGQRYVEGKGEIKMDTTAGLHYIERAAAGGNTTWSVKALAQLGVWSFNGDHGVKKNVAMGTLLLSEAACSGSDFACYNLGWLFKHGKYGFPKDTERAKKWFRKVASCKIKDLHVTKIHKAAVFG